MKTHTATGGNLDDGGGQQQLAHIPPEAHIPPAVLSADRTETGETETELVEGAGNLFASLDVESEELHLAMWAQAAGNGDDDAAESSFEIEPATKRSIPAHQQLPPLGLKNLSYTIDVIQ